MTEPNPEPTARIRPSGRSKTVPSRAVKQRRAADPDTKTAMMEWHHMTPGQRRDAWNDLYRWVGWLYDRYEMSNESRLPECWPLHPGLVEELWALKTWREEIYGRPDTGAGKGGGQAARYWHTEMRNVVTAAKQQYAPSCRAGHKPATPAADAIPKLEEIWREADPLNGVDPRLITRAQSAKTRTQPGSRMTDAEVNEALNTGKAVPLATLVSDHIRLNNAWWMRGDTHWVKIIDVAYSSDLDAAHKRMSAMDKTVDYIKKLTTGKPTGEEK